MSATTDPHARPTSLVMALRPPVPPQPDKAKEPAAGSREIDAPTLPAPPIEESDGCPKKKLNGIAQDPDPPRRWRTRGEEVGVETR